MYLFECTNTKVVLVHSKRYIDIRPYLGYGFWGTVLGYGFGVRFFRVRFSGYGSGVRFWGTVFGVRFWSTVLGYGTVQWYCRVLSIGTLPTLRKNTSFFWYILGYGFGARYGRVVRYVGTVLGYCTVQAYSGIVWSCSTPIQTLRISCWDGLKILKLHITWICLMHSSDLCPT